MTSSFKISRLLLLIAALCALNVSMPSIAQTHKEQHVAGQRPYAATSTDYGYQMFLPAAYATSGKERWPLIIFLHGSGERGSDINIVKVHGPPKIVEKNPNFPFITVSPQLESGGVWDPVKLNRMLAMVKKQVRVDENRIYLTGLSLGGYGTWVWAQHSPQHFAAIAPVAGSTNLIGKEDPIDPCQFKGIGMWAIHGDSDDVVDPAGSFNVVQAARKCGLPARLTIYPETGHDSWTKAYDDAALYTWFLQHRRVRP